MHDHGHGHAHPPATGRVLVWSLCATFAFVLIEALAGVQAHSLALLSDAGHNLTDALALLLAWFAYRVQARPADESRTYGYHRAGVLAAFVNALTLLGLSAWIFWESALRLRDPRQVDESIMMAIAAAGLLLNGCIMLALHSASRHDLNVRSAFIHMLGDALGSLAIIGGAIVMRNTGWTRLDPLLSLLIGALIVWTAWGIIRESLNILLEGLPRGLRLDEVTNAMRGIAGVLDVHDLHIWSLGSSTHALSCHVRIDDVPPSESAVILHALNHMLATRFHIGHTTVQFEHSRCTIEENGCALPSAAQHEHHT